MEKLSASEREKLQGWQRRMITVVAVSMAALLAVVTADLIFDLSRTAAAYAMAGLVGLAGLGVVVQFSQRCPRCGYRIGYQSRLTVPERCKKCGVNLR